MKKILVLSILLIAGAAPAQPRDAGQLVVPNGYEQYDSLRFGLWGADGVPNAVTDSVGCTFDISWGGIDNYPVTLSIGDKKGFEGTYNASPIFKIATYFKQRVFLGLPQRLPFTLPRTSAGLRFSPVPSG